MYGNQVRTALDERNSLRNDVIGQVTTSHSGNLVLRIGQENRPREGWSQTAHVVLTPDEAAAFVAEVSALMGARASAC